MERIGLAPGSEVGGYRIVAPLGSGGMGTVYRAVDGGGTVVALKLLHPHVGADPVARDRLRREVAALQRLHHPAVAAVLDAEADSTEAFIVTELVPGKTLEEHVRDHGPLDPEALADLAADLFGALQAVHAAGVVHRDLKPSNILVTSAGPVLIDFGIAQSADDARVTSTGLVAGTPGYLPPELLDGAYPSATSDWWGWAAVLAFAATGRAPFGVRPVEVVLARARTGQPDLAGLDPMTADALRGALAPDPARRRPAAEVVDALRRAVADPQGAVPTQVIAAGAPAPGPDGGTILLANDGSTRMLAVDPTDAPGAWDPDPAEPDDEPEDRGLSSEDDLGPDEPEVVRLARRWGSVTALGVLAVAGAARSPGITLLVIVGGLLLARTVGSSAQSRDRRRARIGARRTDGVRTVVALPWHLLQALVGILPALLVGVSVMVIVAGVLRWWAGAAPSSGTSARWSVLAGAPVGTGADVTFSVILAIAMACGLLALWWGPASGLTRDGARRTLAAVAPGRGGAGALVLLALAGAIVLVTLTLSGTAITWWPLSEPALTAR